MKCFETDGSTTLTTILNYDSAQRSEKNLAESGVKGTMEMTVLGMQLKFIGTLLSPYDFLIDTKDFISKAIQLIKHEKNKKMLKVLTSYFATYCSKE